ncbi:MAG: UvrD-helicase domain-containing protein [Candidatus Paceibacterota bacterium]
MCDYIITNEEIEKAEKDIFKNGEHFNEEQKTFIKCLDPCCVQAYAGTGKTSTIVAKLHVLAQKNVWQNGRGICVISHTNVAVDEIKKNVAKHYPAIMEYPNFIGTIQEFVNKFLFIPYLASNGMKIKFQDEYRYLDFDDFPAVKERMTKYRNSINRKDNPNKEQQLKKINEAVYSCFLKDQKVSIINNGKIISLIDNFKKLPTKACSETIIFDAFKNCILKRKVEGYFLFYESFIDGFEYIKQNQILKNIISQRFQFAFLDEAQDCSEMQINILKELFDEGSKTIFQQIGDVNQAITEIVWTPVSPLYLGKSERFKMNLSDFVNIFKIDKGSGVVGQPINNPSEKVRLFLIKYDIDKEKDILKKFAEILKKEKIPSDKDFFAISHKHEQLSKYFSEYNKTLTKTQNKKNLIRFNKDIEYLDLLTKESINEQGSNFVSKILLNLMYKHFKTNGGSWSDLKDYLSTSEKKGILKMIIIEICHEILTGGSISDLDILKNKLNLLIESDKINFTNSTANNSVISQNSNNKNVFIDNGITINIGTIHSVKGQTHNATLCFSNYENGKQDIQHSLDTTSTYTPQFKKLLYVASSRPKKLFALAIENNAFDKLTDKTFFQNFKEIVL